MKHEYYMDIALELAKKGVGFTSPNPMVGAVIVKNDRIIGKGYHKAVGKAHAEVNAIADAGDDSKDSTLYVTLEPCNHTGRTPPCTEKIINAGIREVVVAMEDPNPDVTGGGIKFLRSKGIKVSTGQCLKDAEMLNEAFIKHVKTKRPFVTVKCASTLDGQIATATGDSQWVTCDKSREFVHRMRHASDGIMVGINTVVKDDPSLTTRIDGLNGSDPIRIILDTHLLISEKARVLQISSNSDIIIISGLSVSQEKKALIEKTGAKVIESKILVSDKKLIDLDYLMDLLGAEGITSLLIEGGGTVISSAFSAGIVDKVCFFYAPKIMGGNDGVPMCSGKGALLMKNCINVHDIKVRRFDDDVMVEGYIK